MKERVRSPSWEPVEQIHPHLRWIEGPFTYRSRNLYLFTSIGEYLRFHFTSTMYTPSIIRCLYRFLSVVYEFHLRFWLLLLLASQLLLMILILSIVVNVTLVWVILKLSRKLNCSWSPREPDIDKFSDGIWSSCVTYLSLQFLDYVRA